jgi:lysophospholipase L1-like esterase
MQREEKLFIKHLRDRFIILLIGVALMIVLEVIVRLFFPQDFQVNERNNVPLGMVDSVIGHVYRPNAAAFVSGPEYAASYEINAEGMRDEEVHPAAKGDSTVRILLLGDSFAFGVGVDYDSTWSVIFERRCLENGIKVEVIKAGVSGYDTRSELLYLYRLFPKYHPDIVLIAFLSNDLVTNLLLAANESLEGNQSMRQDSMTVRGQSDKFSHFQIVTLAKRMLLSSDFIYTKMYFTTNRSIYYASPMNETLQRQVEVTKKLLLRFQEYCDSNGAKLVILSIPQEIQVIMKARRYAVNGISIDFVDEEFLRFSREHGFLWLPALGTLAQQYQSGFDDLYFRLDGHLNKRGTRMVGEFLYQSLEDSLKGFSHYYFH